MKYRSKPVIVEAERFDPAASCWPVSVCSASFGCFFVTTPDGRLHVMPGTWIIQERSGKIGTRSDVQFALEYEPASEVEA